jgi:uncharacterized protein YbjT (DUF2867 family)
MSNSDKKVFVTGATGFICTHILQLLIEVNHLTLVSFLISN